MPTRKQKKAMKLRGDKPHKRRGSAPPDAYHQPVRSHGERKHGKVHKAAPKYDIVKVLKDAAGKTIGYIRNPLDTEPPLSDVEWLDSDGKVITKIPRSNLLSGVDLASGPDIHVETKPSIPPQAPPEA
jgi:hypothetical protein